jgi:hypothetical protein
VNFNETLRKRKKSVVQARLGINESYCERIQEKKKKQHKIVERSSVTSATLYCAYANRNSTIDRRAEMHNGVFEKKKKKKKKRKTNLDRRRRSLVSPR